MTEKVLRDRLHDIANDSFFKDYYDKGHELNDPPTRCIKCGQYLVDMAECFQTPNCENVASKIIVPENNIALMIHSESNTPLLKINRDGTIDADSLENACEAGKIFVKSIMHHISPSTIVPMFDIVNDEQLNKTEDLHLLSKILDAWNNGRNISEAVGFISSIRKADRSRISELSKQVKDLKDQLDIEIINE